MNSQTVMASIKAALGNPESGVIAEQLPVIDAAVKEAFGEGGTKKATPVKETRVVEAAETR